MGFLGKFKDLWNSTSARADDDDYYDDYLDDDYEEEEEAPVEYSRPKRRPVTDDKVVSIHATAKLQVVIVKPERFEEVAEIADNLIEKRTVVLNLEQSQKDIARRIVDFLSGAAYAHDGQLKRIANNTYIITPFNVGLIGTDVLDELENNGVFF